MLKPSSRGSLTSEKLSLSYSFTPAGRPAAASRLFELFFSCFAHLSFFFSSPWLEAGLPRPLTPPTPHRALCDLYSVFVLLERRIWRTKKESNLGSFKQPEKQVHRVQSFYPFVFIPLLLFENMDYP